MKLNINIEVDSTELIQFILSSYFGYDCLNKENFTSCIMDYLEDNIEFDNIASINPEDIQSIASKVKNAAITGLTF